MRNTFANLIHEEMSKNKDILFITGDVGFGVLDKIKQDFPDRFFNFGSCEQSMIGIACGMALDGKIPIVYTITPFLIYRPFETIRNYVNYESVPIKLVGAGRDKDYGYLGFSHWCEELKDVLNIFKNIQQFWPNNKEEVAPVFQDFLYNKKPSFLSLKR